MKKLFIPIFLICLLLSACATTKPAEPSKPSITVHKGAVVSVECSYSGDKWLFITGVEFRNAAGDTRRCVFKNTRRTVHKGARVHEFGYFAFAHGEAFLEWCGEGVEVRPLCDGYFDFEPAFFVEKK